MNQEIAITKIQFDVNEIIKKGEQQIFDIANQKHKDGNTYRNSKVTWIKKWPELTQHIDKSISTFQKTWGFDLKVFEPYNTQIIMKATIMIGTMTNTNQHMVMV